VASSPANREHHCKCVGIPLYDSPMALFSTDSVVLICTNVEAAKRWWIDVFDGKPMKPPADWDSSLPSDVAIKLPGHDQPTVLLTDKTELEQSHMDTSQTYPVLFTSKLKKAHEHILSKGVAPGPTQDGGDMPFFEITDPRDIQSRFVRKNDRGKTVSLTTSLHLSSRAQRGNPILTTIQCQSSLKAAAAACSRGTNASRTPLLGVHNRQHLGHSVHRCHQRLARPLHGTQVW